MAKITYTSPVNEKKSSSDHIYFHFSLADVGTWLRNNGVGAYAKINSMYLTAYVANDVKSSKANLQVNVTPDGSDTKSVGGYSNFIDKTSSVGGNNSDISKYDSYSSTTTNLAPLFNNENANTPYVLDSYTSATVLIHTYLFVLKSFNWKTYFTLEVDYTPHSCSWDSGTVTSQPTCTATGVKTYTCSVCKTTKTETIPAKGHTEVTIPAVAATCTSTGLTEGKKCSVCGTVTVAQTTLAKDPNNHTGSQTTIPSVNPTRTTSGLTEGKKWSCCNAIITAQQTTHLVTVVCGEGGTVTGLNVGDNVVIDGDKITLTATPNEGYRFYGFRVSNKDGNDIIERYESNTIIITNNIYLSVEAIFEKLAPEITLVQMLYQNKQISETNKVPAGQYFRIVVGAK